MWKVASLLCVLLLTLCAVTVFAAAEEAEEITIVASGYCGAEGDGTNLTWKLTDDGYCVIEGTGAMQEEGWLDSYIDLVKYVIVKDGVTSIGWLDGDVAGVEISDSVTAVEPLFSPFGALYVLYYHGTLEQWDEVEIFGGNMTPVDGINCFPDHFVTDGYRNNFDGTHTFGAFCTDCFDAAPSTLLEGVTEACVDVDGRPGCDLCGYGVSITGTCGAGDDGSNLTWELTGDCELIISGEGKMATYADTARGKAPWYQYSGRIKTVTVKDGVTSIGAYAFLGCDALAQIELPDSLETIGDHAFYYNTALTEIEIPDSVTYIGSSAFYGCKALASVKLSENIAVIWGRVFGYCSSLTEIEIPSSVTTISDSAFYGSGLIEIEIPNSVTTIYPAAFSCCKALRTVSLSEKLTEVDEDVFSGCTALTEIEIPVSVRFIEDGAFHDCSALTDVYYFGTAAQWAAVRIYDNNDASLTSAERHYMTCNYENNGKLTHLYTNACSDCGEPSPSVGSSGVMRACIDKDANAACDLCGGDTEELLPYGFCGGEGDGTNLSWSLSKDGVLTISGSGAMQAQTANNAPWSDYRSAIKAVIICDGVTTIGENAFYYCRNMTEIEIPDSVVSIGDWAFFYCESLTSLTIPDGVQNLGLYTIAYCKALTTLKIGAGVTSIDGKAIHYCDVLPEVIVDEDNTAFKAIDGVLFTIDGKKLVYYPTGKAQTYYEIPNGVMTIGDLAFFNAIGLTGLHIPDSVIEIGDDALRQCRNLLSLFIPSSVTSVGERAFMSLDSLNHVVLGEGRTEIGPEIVPVVRNYENTPLLELPASITLIKAGTFSQTYVGYRYLYYYGTADQWDAITIEANNEALIYNQTYKRIHYMTSSYVNNGDDTHTGSVYCTDCGTYAPSIGQVSFTEACVDRDGDKLCDGCGGVYCEHTDIAEQYTALGEREHEHITTCNDCGKTTTVTASCTDEDLDTVCDLCGANMIVIETFDIYGSNMTLGSELVLSVFFKKSYISGDDWTVEVVHGDETIVIPMDRWIGHSRTLYRVGVGVAAKEMADDLQVVIKDGEGYPRSESYSISVRKYAMKALSSDKYNAQALDTLMVDMLIYGAAAQEHFFYNIEDLATAQLTQEQLALATPAVNVSNKQVKGPKCVGSNLTLEERILMNMIFSGLTDSNVVDKYAVISFTDRDGKEKIFRIEGSDFIDVGSYKAVRVDQIVPADAFQLVTVTVYEADGTVYGYGSDSLESYSARFGGPLAAAIMRFSASAKAYLTK